MRDNTGIIRLHANGPDGLTPVAVDPAEFDTPPEAQNLHIYFADPALGLNVGVWQSAPMQEAFGPFPGDEFIVMLEGAFGLRDGAGTGVGAGAKAGQCAAIRNGIPVSWHQDGSVRKFFMTYNDPRAAAPQDLTAKGGLTTLSPEMTLTDAELMEDTSTPQRDRILFSNDLGNFDVGLWDTQVLNTELEPFPYHEMAQVLEGEVYLTEADGTRHHFTAGDVFFIPAGTPCIWHVPSYLRKFYAALDPENRPDG
ncbi:DUF861 domain-containing protein [Roseovarius mucosus]|uniref:cupin domain-containing protein n=1 Tax=Roseovarius mucosus TaxID=215743 RepID=UPI001C5E04B7|nr:cupin domain-containing protein [Roseovarius mucosus]MBW4974385.1 DUF861 domain-containing protein [Roseovarius mucosus]